MDRERAVSYDSEESYCQNTRGKGLGEVGYETGAQKSIIVHGTCTTGTVQGPGTSRHLTHGADIGNIWTRVIWTRVNRDLGNYRMLIVFTIILLACSLGAGEDEGGGAVARNAQANIIGDGPRRFSGGVIAFQGLSSPFRSAINSRDG